MKIKLTENLKYFGMLIYEINKLHFPKKGLIILSCGVKSSEKKINTRM